MRKGEKNMNKEAPRASGYSETGASLNRRALRGFRPDSGAPAKDINNNLSVLRQRSRMLFMSSPLATSAINTQRTKIIGTGLTLKSAIDRERLGLSPDDAKAWQKKTEAEFKLWAGSRNCDALGLNDFVGLQQLAVKSWLLSGDVIAVVKRANATPLAPYSMRLHLIEADRVSTPDEYGLNDYLLSDTEGVVGEGKPGEGRHIYDGVEVDADGRVTAYYIRDSYPGELKAEKTTWVRVEAVGEKTGLANVFHVMDSERPDQYRGVPYLAQVIEPMLQLRRYTDATLMAANIQTMFTAFITTETDQSEIPINEVGESEYGGIPSEPPEGISRGENEYELGQGTIVHLAPGEKTQFANPSIPTPTFDNFTKVFAKLMGAALETPYDVLVKEFDASYSASRGALLEAWETIKMRRAWFVSDFCQPVYETWLAEAVARGRIKAPGFFDDAAVRAAWSGAHWIGPVQGQLDPKKEVEAALAMAKYSIKTYEQITRELGGGNWEENINETDYEVGKLIQQENMRERGQMT